MEIIRYHSQLKVYQKSVAVSMEIFRLTKNFPKEETYSLSDQIRQSSRSVSASIAEAFKRRIYLKSFCSKLNESEAEAAETQSWLHYALACQYLKDDEHKKMDETYSEIISMLVKMQQYPQKWSIQKP
ncbi:MAG: four helix bundle protein [Bacteroidia bacterium]|nr:four helix bundle protein [Bacteroidia bacterium]